MTDVKTKWGKQVSVEIRTADDDVIEITITGRVEKEDIQRCVPVVDHALKSERSLSFYVEVKDLDGISLEAVLADVALALRHVQDLYRFERVALVTNSEGLEKIAKVENFILWQVDIQTFKVAQRDEAREWAAGAAPVVPGISFLKTGVVNTLSVTIDGRVTGYDLREIANRVDEMFESQGKVNLLARITKFPKLGKGVLSEKLRMFSLLGKIRRYAVVAPGWMAPQIALINPLLTLEIRHFPTDEYEEALNWLSKGYPEIPALPEAQSGLAPSVEQSPVESVAGSVD